MIKRFVIQTQTKGRYSLFTVTLPKEAPFFPLFFFESEPSYEQIKDLKVLENKIETVLSSDENQQLIEKLLKYELETELEAA